MHARWARNVAVVDVEWGEAPGFPAVVSCSALAAIHVIAPSEHANVGFEIPGS